MRKLLTAALFAIIAISGCKKDESETIPTVSFEATTATMAENYTGDYKVKVTLSNPVSKPLSIPFTVSGTAVSNVNYQMAEGNTISIAAGATEGYILIKPLTDNSFNNYVLTFTLGSGTGFILSTDKAKVDITITNTGVLASTTIAFERDGEILTNPLLGEKIDITVGLTEPVPFDLNIPITVGGTATASDYAFEGLVDGKLAIAANAVTATFSVKVSKAVITSEKTLLLGFTAGDGYTIASTKNSLTIAMINPEVDFATSWFNTGSKYNFYYLSGGLSNQYDTKISYRQKKYRWEDPGTGFAWKSNTGICYSIAEPDKRNSWVPQTHSFLKKMTNWAAVKVVEQERYELQGSDLFGLSNLFPADYIIGFGSSISTYEQVTNGWFSFAPTQRDGKKGKVLLADQDLVLYKAKAGVTWKSSAVDAGGNTIYDWYADSRNALGVIANSARAEMVVVKLENVVGTYDFTTNEIIVDITVSSTDANFAVPAGQYVSKTADGKYNLRYKFIPFA
jgi:hypothetical protein